MTSSLFKPFSCRGLTVPNRIVMAPMTRSQSPGGIPGDNVADYYARRAAADVGMIVTEGTSPDRPAASADVNVPNFYTPEALSGWRNVAKKVHDAGGKIGPQIWHEGMMRKPGSGPHPDAPSDSPSGLTHTGKQVAEAPSESDVADMIASYGRAAKNAADLGFDFVEIHGAHGYLIDEFFWDRMNARTDQYGGDTLAQRATFAAEVVKDIRNSIGDDIPISFRFSQWKQQDFEVQMADTPQKLEDFLKVLVDAGVDIFHCSTRRYWEPEFEGSDLNLAGWTKKLTGLPTITVGSVGLSSDFIGSLFGKGSAKSSLDDVEARLDRGEFDLVAVGRALLQDPEWAKKVKEGRTDELADFDAENRNVYY